MEDIKKDIRNVFDLFMGGWTKIEIKYDAIVNDKKKKIMNKEKC